MRENKLSTIINLFEGNEIISIWSSEKEDYYFSVVDVISALTESSNPRKYWSVLKNRLKNEGSDVTTNCSQLKMLAPDGKMRLRDAMSTKNIFRLIESVPSPKAETFKMWLASLGKERIDEIFDPEKAIERAIKYYIEKGYTDEWIEARIKGILNRKKLTDVWFKNGITKDYEYAILTNTIYNEWSGMNAKEYKGYKNLKKESLRDNMTDIEIIFTDLGEITTKDIVINEKPIGMKKNLKAAKRGGSVSKITKEHYEKTTGNKAITNKNFINKK